MSGRYMGMLSYERKAVSKQFAAMSDDGGDQQARYCDEIKAQGIGDPAEFLVDTWLDEMVLSEHDADKRQFALKSLRLQLLYVLRANLSELEIAENVARLEGQQSFSEWMEERS